MILKSGDFFYWAGSKPALLVFTNEDHQEEVP